MATQVTAKRRSPAGRGVASCEAGQRSRVAGSSKLPTGRFEQRINQNNLITQNKPNFPAERMNVSDVSTKCYKNTPLSCRPQNKPNSNPIKANLSQFQAQTNPTQTQFQTPLLPVVNRLTYQRETGPNLH